MKWQVWTFALLFLLPTGAVHAAAGSEWRGLWSITQQTDNGPQLFSLFIHESGDSADFYGSDWLPLPTSEFRAEGSTLLLNWLTKGVNVAFEGTRRGDRISGKWRLLHPQFHEDGQFSGRRVLSVSRWSPLAFAPTGAVADLNGELAKHAEDLDDYWISTFKPRYLVFLEPESDVSGVRERLQDDKFATGSRELAEALGELAKDVPAKLHGFKLPGAMVLVPFGPRDEFRLDFVGDRSFLVLNPDRMLSPEGRRRGELARKLLTTLIDSQFAGANRSLRLVRAGLKAHALVQLGAAGDDREASGLSETEWAAQRGRLTEIKQKIGANRELTAAETAVAGIDFVNFLTADRSFAKIYGAPTFELDRDLRDYLRM